ncbi:MAG: hypothetical protein SGI99_07970 [Pseudomonadota bacterium]|nr:hypothetical protein [Pseudomonadota bacterium]
MARKQYEPSQLHELLYQALETELGGIQIYQAAIACAVNEDLRKEWQDYLDETKTHKRVLLDVFAEFKLDPAEMTPGRRAVAHIGSALVNAIRIAKESAAPEAAQLVAAECVVLAETKDHMNWELIGHLATHGRGPHTAILKKAHDLVEQEEDHHLYHTKGWTRELWIDSFGMPALLPPPEEVKKVETAIGAARAEQARDTMLSSAS